MLKHTGWETFNIHFIQCYKQRCGLTALTCQWLFLKYTAVPVRHIFSKSEGSAPWHRSVFFLSGNSFSTLAEQQLSLKEFLDVCSVFFSSVAGSLASKAWAAALSWVYNCQTAGCVSTLAAMRVSMFTFSFKLQLSSCSTNYRSHKTTQSGWNLDLIFSKNKKNKIFWD